MAGEQGDSSREGGEASDNNLDGDIIAPASGSTLAILHGTEVDRQVATARRFPRNLTEVAATIKSLATLDEDTAEECIYALPRGGKHIRGPSARFADILLNTWGNARSASYVTTIDKEGGFVEAVGMFYDIQRNVARQRSIRRRITDKNGRVFNDDMILMTCNAASSIAERNAILAGVPKPLWVSAYNAAFSLIAGTTATLTEKRDRALGAFAKLGIPTERVLDLLKKRDVSQIEVDDIPTLRGVLQAIRNGEETIATVFGSGAVEAPDKGSPLKDPKPESGGAKTDPISTGIAKAQEQQEPAQQQQQEPTKQAVVAETPQDAGFNPKTATTDAYMAYARAWIGTDAPETIRARWSTERKMRNEITGRDRMLQEEELLELTGAINKRAVGA